MTGCVDDEFRAKALEPTVREPERSLTGLYGRYRAELLALVRRAIGRGPPEPEDIVQQAFVNFAAQKTDDLDNPRAYLYRTAHNLAINASKRERIRQRYRECALESKETHQGRPDGDPETVLAHRERDHLLRAAIRALPRRRRIYLLMNRVEGLSYAEIGRRMNLSESVIRKQVGLAVSECAAALRAAEEGRRLP